MRKAIELKSQFVSEIVEKLSARTGLFSVVCLPIKIPPTNNSDIMITMANCRK